MGFFSKDKKENNGFVINTDDEAIKISGDKKLAPHAMTPGEVSNLSAFDDDANIPATNALDSLKKRMNASSENETKQKAFTDKPNKTLVEKIKRYTIDEHGHDVSENKEPLYQLESVAEILKTDSEDTLKELSKKYGIDFDGLEKSKSQKSTLNVSEKEKINKNISAGNGAPKAPASPTPAFEKMVSDAAERESKELLDSLFPSEEKPETLDISVPDISDIDTHEVGISTESPSNTATIRFTPITDRKGNTDHISISNVTKHIDLDDNIPDDITSHSATQLEQSDFDDFVPSAEYTDNVSGKKLLVKFARAKRNYFLSAFISALMLICLSVYLVPSVYDHILNTKTTDTAMFVCTSFLSVSIIANANMFLNFKNILVKNCSFDIMAAFCSVAVWVLGVTAALTKSNAYYIILLCAITLFIRAVCKFKYASAQYISLKQIKNEKTKNAVTLISDPATTFAMAKNSIDGDILAIGHKKSNFIEDFMKHFEFYKTMFGKVGLTFFITLFVSSIAGIMAYFYYKNTFDAVYASSCVICFAAMPCAFLIDTVPFSSAAKLLGKKGGMIAGIYGAQKIENANAAVVKTTDIFPEGTVVMHNMKVLSNNNIDETLLRAASLTAAVGSPLESIFKKIAGTNDAYSIPDADTIKYEKNLGISGWVDNEPLFIGNRSLMRAHGIEIPSLEVDKKILRKGFFPVYVATSNTACALIVIQYNVDSEVAKEIHKITDLGVLLLLENCDPNVTEEMVCDYFGLYEGSVKVMSNAGVHMYKNAVPDTENCSAAATYRGSGLNLVKIINRASGIKSANKLLTVMYVLFSVLGILYFIYGAFAGLMAMPGPTTVLGYSLITLALSIIGFLIRKP